MRGIARRVIKAGMICSNSIPRAVRSIARQLGPKPLFIDIMSGREVNWVEFKNHAWAAASGLIKAGVQTGDGVILIGFDDIDGLEFEIGCQAAGGVGFTAPTSLTPDGLINVVLMSRCSHFVLSDSDPAFLAATRALLEPLSSLISEIPAANLRDHAYDTDVIPDADSDDATVESRIGTLGPETQAAGFHHRLPDGREMVVALSHSNLQSMAATVATELMADENDVWTCLQPLSSTFARIACWYAALLSGGTISMAPAGHRPVEALFLTQPSFVICDGQSASAIDAGIMDELGQLQGARGRVTRWGFQHACRRNAEARESHGMTDSLADLAVERLVRDIPGGRLRAIISSGPDLDATGRCRLLTAGVELWTVFAPASVSCFLAVARNGSIRTGSIGRPLRETSVRPDDGGALLVEGPLVMVSEMCTPSQTCPHLDGKILKSGLRGSVDADGFVYIEDGAQ